MYTILFQNVESLKYPKDHPLSQPTGESVTELLCPFRARARRASMLPVNRSGAVVGKLSPHSDSNAATQDLWKRPSLLVLVTGTSSTTWRGERETV